VGSSTAGYVGQGNPVAGAPIGHMHQTDTMRRVLRRVRMGE
jgi:hypothetical protein